MHLRAEAEGRGDGHAKGAHVPPKRTIQDVIAGTRPARSAAVVSRGGERSDLPSCAGRPPRPRGARSVMCLQLFFAVVSPQITTQNPMLHTPHTNSTDLTNAVAIYSISALCLSLIPALVASP